MLTDIVICIGAVIGPLDFSQRQLSPSLTNVMCTGNESLLTHCDSVMSSICIGGDDAEVVCQGEWQTENYIAF